MTAAPPVTVKAALLTLVYTDNQKYGNGQHSRIQEIWVAFSSSMQITHTHTHTDYSLQLSFNPIRPPGMKGVYLMSLLYMGLSIQYLPWRGKQAAHFDTCLLQPLCFHRKRQGIENKFSKHLLLFKHYSKVLKMPRALLSKGLLIVN